MGGESKVKTEGKERESIKRGHRLLAYRAEEEKTEKQIKD